MDVDPKEAAEALKVIEQAQQVVSRHSHNNGVIPLVWGIVILLALPMYDILPPPIASIAFFIIVGLTAFWNVMYAMRIPVQPWKWKYKGPFLFLWWGLYYAIVLIGGVSGLRWPFHCKPPFLFNIITVCAAGSLSCIMLRL